MKPALDRGLRKAGRTLFQMAAAGSLTVLVDFMAHGLAPEQAAAVLAIWGVIVTFLHNYLETKGTIPVLLPAAGLVTTATGGLVDKAVGTVDAVVGNRDAQNVGGAVASTTHVVGQVLDTGGRALGSVGGTVTGLLGSPDLMTVEHTDDTDGGGT